MVMLNELNIAHTGRHHSGIDDCTNIVNIVLTLIRDRKHKFDITYDMMWSWSAIQKKPKPVAAATPRPAPSETVDISRIDLRVGHILSAERHPDADGLYVEKIDVGEQRPRTIVSALVKHVPLEQVRQTA